MSDIQEWNKNYSLCQSLDNIENIELWVMMYKPGRKTILGPNLYKGAASTQICPEGVTDELVCVRPYFHRDLSYRFRNQVAIGLHIKDESWERDLEQSNQIKHINNKYQSMCNYDNNSCIRLDYIVPNFSYLDKELQSKYLSSEYLLNLFIGMVTAVDLPNQVLVNLHDPLMLLFLDKYRALVEGHFRTYASQFKS